MTRRVLLGLASLLVAACSAAIPGIGGPGHAEDTAGSFRLSFDMPTTTWRPDQGMIGTAELALIDGPAVDIGGSGGGAIVFSVAEVDGRRAFGGGMTADCWTRELALGRPETTGLVKSGGFAADDPDAAFFQAFFADPEYRLPKGEWDITASASFIEGEGCQGEAYSLSATIRVKVVG